MIGYFPELYPDELLYSAIARYAARVRYPSHKILLRDLFGTDTVTAVIDLPTRVEALVSRLPALTELTSDALIDRHSLWPIYAPFQPQRRHQAILRKMKGDGGGAVHVQAGIPAGRVHPPQFLRFCTECAVEDRQHYGEAYWHRVHQASGIQACAKHQVLLQDSDVRRADRKARHVFVSADSSLPAAQPARPHPDATLVKLVSWCDQNRTAVCDQKRNNGQNAVFAIAALTDSLILQGASAEDRALRGRNLSAD